MKPPTATFPTLPATSALDIDAEAVAADLEDRDATAALEWMFETFGDNHYIACSFQKTSSVTLHLALQINSDARFFYLDTDVLFPETYAIRDQLADHFGIEFDRFHNITLEEQAEQFGDKLWKTDPDACCGLRKVEPMRRALGSVDVWVSGIRREDNQHRAGAPKFARDKRFDLWKLNPLADWSEEQVWSYINDNHIPYNPLHDQGYPSIGCTHCTKPVAPGEDPRGGRWSGTTKSECGIN